MPCVIGKLICKLTSLQEMGVGHMGFTLPIGLTSGPVKCIRVVGKPHNVDMWVLCANLKHTFGDEKGQFSSSFSETWSYFMAQAMNNVFTKEKSPKVKWHPKMEVLVIVGSSNMQVDDMS